MLDDLYPDSEHVYHLGMDLASDRMIWDYALENKFIIVTKDADFGDLSVLLGFPPKVIWIRSGNCATAVIENILRKHFSDIENFEANNELGLFVLY